MRRQPRDRFGRWIQASIKLAKRSIQKDIKGFQAIGKAVIGPTPYTVAPRRKKAATTKRTRVTRIPRK